MLTTILLVAFVLFVLAALFVWHWRERRAWDAWVQQMEHEGAARRSLMTRPVDLHTYLRTASPPSSTAREAPQQKYGKRI